MKVRDINEVSDLLRVVKEFSTVPSLFIFRGQNRDWELQPSLLRTKKEDNLKIERALLGQLQLHKPILPSELSDFFDLLIFGQQHSMPTRLLDWSYNPLIALWFACNNKSNDFKGDGYLYYFDSSSLVDARKKFTFDSVNHYKSEVDKIEDWYILRPGPLFDRLKSQSGVFTLMPNDTSNKFGVQKMRIPNKSKVPILLELGKLIINEYTIYGDFDSLCRTIHWETNRNKLLIGDKDYFDDTGIMILN